MESLISLPLNVMKDSIVPHPLIIIEIMIQLFYVCYHKAEKTAHFRVVFDSAILLECLRLQKKAFFT